MGGNLFRFPRMPRNEYLAVDGHVRSVLRSILGPEGEAWAVPRWYGDKADFGDMDVLVRSRPDWAVKRTEVARAMDEAGVGLARKVGDFFTVPVRGLQVDLFSVGADPEALEAAYSFMCFNDLGNLMGRIARAFNAKFGEKGLLYVWRSEDEGRSRDIPLTRDFRRVCKFLDLDHGEWMRGFQSREQMFEWVTRSSRFSVSPYLDEPARSNVLKRCKDRQTIAAFGQWLIEKGLSARPDFGPRKSEERVKHLDDEFPEAGLRVQIKELEDDYKRVQSVREKFSGDLVMRLRPGLKGEELGRFMAEFKKSRFEFEDWILRTDASDIESAIMSFRPPSLPG